MPDGPNPYQTNDEEDEIDGQFSGDQNWATQSSQPPKFNPNSLPMPRKAIARKPTIETSYPASDGSDLNYGVHEDPGESGTGYQKYAPAPSKMSMRKHMKQSLEKNEMPPSSGADNPLKTVLFQFASILPGMGIRPEAPKPKPKVENTFKAPTFDGPREPKQAAAPRKEDFAQAGPLHRKSALEDLKREETRSSRDSGVLEQSALAKFMEKLFPSTNSDTTVQEVEDPSTKRKKMFIRFGAMAVFALLVIGAYKLIPRQTQYFEKFPLEFRTTDNEKSFKIVDPANAIFAIGSDNIKTPVTCFFGDWRDYADVVLATPFQKQVWLEKTDEGVKDLNSNFQLFDQRAPQSISAKETQKIADAAISYYEKKHAYPTTSAELGKYFNPYTEKEEPVQIKQITEGDTKSGEDVDVKKSDLYRDLVFSKAKIESKAAPGSIACWNIHFVAAHQSLNVFIIKPYGKNGEPIITGHTDAQLFIALEDGQPKELFASKPLFEWVGKSGSILPKSTVFFVNKVDPALLFAMRHAAKVFFTIIAFASVGFLLSLKKGEAPWFWIFVLTASGVPALLALFGNFIP